MARRSNRSANRHPGKTAGLISVRSDQAREKWAGFLVSSGQVRPANYRVRHCAAGLLSAAGRDELKPVLTETAAGVLTVPQWGPATRAGIS